MAVTVYGGVPPYTFQGPIAYVKITFLSKRGLRGAIPFVICDMIEHPYALKLRGLSDLVA